jgi:hypothetical protein
MVTARSVSIDTDPRGGWAWLARAGALLSAAAPFLVALEHASTSSVWRDDIVVLRGVGCVGWGYSGCVSALLAQLAFFLPLGPVHFRLALMAAIVLGAAGWAVHALTRDLLARSAATPPLLVNALPSIAALTATRSATGQTQGALAGGSGVTLLVASLLLRADPAAALGEPRRAVPVGMMAGALVAESSVTALTVGAAIALALLLSQQKTNLPGAPFAMGSALASAALLVSPVWLRALAAAPFLQIGRAVSAVSDVSPAMRPVGGALGRLTADGSILPGMAALGFGVGLAQRRLRAAIVPFVVITVLYGASIFGEGRLFAAQDLAPLHLVTTGALAIGAAVAVQAVATALFAWQLPMAKGASILLVMTDLTLAVANAEEASFAIERRAPHQAEAFTDEALESLPSGAALLVRSRQAAWRMWAAQLAHGSRSDVIVVPLPGTGDTRLALRLLRAEPALQKALQDISLEGRPGEEALTILADARPVLTELDPGWDRRVYSHFVPEHLWLRFAPEPRGPSDRKAAFSEMHFDRVPATYAGGPLASELDPDAAIVQRARLTDAAVLAALLGDREEAKSLAGRIGAVPGGELLAAELMQRLLATKSGPLDVRNLLR